MNEHRSSAGRVRRLLPDDPRFAACTLWLRTSTLSPATQEKVRAAIFKALDESDEYTSYDEPEVEDEVRQPGVAEEVQSRPLRPKAKVEPELWELWERHYGVDGARILCQQAGVAPLE